MLSRAVAAAAVPAVSRVAFTSASEAGLHQSAGAGLTAT